MLERGSLLASAGVIALVTMFSGTATAQEPGAGTTAISKKIAILGFDALGMDSERVDRLETLFRMEIDRLAGTPTPTRREIDRRLTRRLKRCGPANKCLAAIARRLQVDLVVSGNVAALGDSYVVNIKVVEGSSGSELRRIASDPLRGEPDELIEAIRVAAYRLLAPERLKGSVEILADRSGAEVTLDGVKVGTTPLGKPIANLALGPHAVEVSADGFAPFSKQITVRFQKSTKVIVHLEAESTETGVTPIGPITPQQPPPAPARWYESTWFLVGAGVAVIAAGSYIGYQLGQETVINCRQDPEQCRN